MNSQLITASGRRLFIYYKVAEGYIEEITLEVRAIQRNLSLQSTALKAEVMRRPNPSNGVVTIMEIYSAPGGITDAMEASIEGAFAALSRRINAARHTEIFEDLSI